MKTKNSTHFWGVPTTVAGGLLASLAILHPSVLPEYMMSFAMSVLMLALSFVMLVKVKYYRVEIRKRKTLTFVLAGYGSLFAVSMGAFMLITLMMFLGYIVFGWTKWMRRKEVDSLIPE
jgi:phosphatidylserine synthase